MLEPTRSRGTVARPARLLVHAQAIRSSLGRGPRGARRAQRRDCAGRALRPRRPGGVRPRVQGAPGRPARRGRRPGSLPRRVAHGSRLPGRAGEGDHVDPDARPSTRRRPRPPRGATPGGAARRRPTMSRRPIPPRTRPGSDSSASASRRASGSCRTRSARRSSSPTTEASPSPSSPRGSGYRSVRSRAGCSPGSRV